MKVIDLLNKIANNEDIPEKIIFNSRIYELTKRDDDLYNYKNNFSNNYFEDDWFLTNILNDEIEIIEDTPKEDKKIKKLDYLNSDYYYKNNTYGSISSEEIVLDIKAIENYINKIVDKINGDSNE